MTCKPCKRLQVQYTLFSANDEPSSIHISEEESNCWGLCQTLHLGVGSRVMLLRNIETRSGFVNGAQGTVVAFHWASEDNEHNQNMALTPSEISVLFDDPTVGSVFDDSTHQPIVIKTNCCYL